MATITPSSVELQPNETQQFTTDISSPVWTLEGLGTLDQSGQYSAPSSLGSALVRVHTSGWSYVDNAYYTKNSDDTLTKANNDNKYDTVFKSTALLNSVGDYVEFICFTNNPYSIGLRNAALDYRVLYISGAPPNYILEVHPTGNVSSGALSQFANGDVIRFEIITGGYVAITVNGNPYYTTTKTFSGQNLYFHFDDFNIPSGTIVKYPRFNASNYSEAQGSIIISLSVESFLQKDSLIQFVPKSALEQWIAANKNINTGTEITLVDLSQNNRAVMCDADLPEVQEDILNGLEAVYFDGTSSTQPLIYEGSTPVKHLFLVCAYEDEDFPVGEYPGILSGLNTYSLVVGKNNGSDEFYNFTDYGDYKYCKSEVQFDLDGQKAPMNGTFAVLEIQYPSLLTLNGITIGRDRNYLSGRFWKGWFVESLIYSEIKSEFDRCEIYKYFAMKYHLWSKNADGLNVFPFPANRARNLERGQETYLSEPYDGDRKALVRGGFSRAFQLPFELRPQAEYEAAEQFHSEHFPLTRFIFRDYRYHPYKERTIRFLSNIREQGSGISHRFNYAFEASED